MKKLPNARIFQAVQHSASQEQHNISTVTDPVTGDQVVLWDDVLLVFEDARFARDHVATIPFLRGDNFQELVPRRIAHYPDTVLEIVLKGETSRQSSASSSSIAERPAVPVRSPDRSSGTSSSVGGSNVYSARPAICCQHENNEIPFTSGSAGSMQCTEEITSSPTQHTESLRTPPSSPPGYTSSNHSHHRHEEEEHLPIYTTTVAPPSARAVETQSSSRFKHDKSWHGLVASAVFFNKLQISDSALDSDNSQDAKALGQFQEDLNPKAQQSLIYILQLYDRHFQALQGGQIAQAKGIKEDMNRHYEDLKSEMEKNGVLSAQLLEMQTRMTKMQTEMSKAQQQMLDMQQLTLDRLANMQTKIKALLTQTYELHEYPIPRLFIVLPKVVRRRDKIMSPFTDQFRLYFLCECGKHTTKDGVKAIDQVHMAKHEGYDIDRPTAFFQKYGPYVLAMMQMLKIGISVAGVIVPQLAHFEITETLDKAQKALGFSEENINFLVDHTISYIEGQNRNDNGGITMDLGDNSETQNFDQLEALEGVELGQLQSFLTASDKGRVLGNLYRTVTDDGHVKWVCRDHFRANYRESAQKSFLRIVQENGGSFDEDLGSLTIILSSRTVAKVFYAALAEARGVNELDIYLSWEVSMDDLRTFATALINSKVVSLTFQCFSASSSFADIANRNRRFTPLIQMLANGRLQSVRFRGDLPLFDRVEMSSILPAPRLRLLRLRFPTIPTASGLDALCRTLQRCIGLKNLELHFPRAFEGQLLASFIERLLLSGNHLEHLTVSSWEWANLCLFERQVKLLKRTHAGGENGFRLQTLILIEPSAHESQWRLTFGVDVSATEVATLGKTDTPQYLLQSSILRSKGHLLEAMDIMHVEIGPLLVRLIKTQVDKNNGLSNLKSVRVSTTGMEVATIDPLWSIIERSLQLEVFQLIMAKHWDGAGSLTNQVFDRFAPIATEIQLQGDLSWIGETMDRRFLPKMTSLCWKPRGSLVANWDEEASGAYASLHRSKNSDQGATERELATDSLSRLLKLIATPDSLSPSSSSSSSLPTACNTQIAPLRSLEFYPADFEMSEWERLFQVLDFSTLEYLGLANSNFSEKHFELLLDSIENSTACRGGVDGSNVVALKQLDIVGSTLGSDSPEGLQERLWARAPKAELVEEFKRIQTEDRFGAFARLETEWTSPW
ncbi:hypothetical protein EMPS_03876 [Entomortierella parvispora]|uniref:Uncharacterized protein n=1 Tax=Entomortierella parvispora TaxID=205924 RepID=A0A9P3H7G6_9FUNG|nr:hypothetical protein EMPS_03876 [Entomortierella parvispora]